MARNLNKTRMLSSRIIILAVFVIVFFTDTLIRFDAPAHELLEFAGYILIALCAMGRLYATAFLGGHKNETLIDYGAFSIVRNPLYFFSLLGITGMALISGHLLVIICVPLAFCWLYILLIKREEGFLSDKFGAAYDEYRRTVPRLFPKFSLYQAPDTVPMAPNFLKKAFFDAIWWFAVFPLFEGAEWFLDQGYIKPFLTVW